MCQRKRAIESESEEQRPCAKSKARQRQNKRSACNTSGSVEQPALNRKDQRLTAESFQACARDSSEFEDRLLEELGAASSSTASLSEQQRKRRLTGVVNDLQKLIASAWKREGYIAEHERSEAGGVER